MSEAEANNGGEASEVLPEALELFKPFEQFCRCLLDPYVVVDAAGRAVKCNPLFGPLLGLRTKQILKATSLDDVLSLHVGGSLLTAVQLAQVPGPTRYDEVAASGAERKDLSFIIGVFPLVKDGVNKGAFILVRDVTAEASLQDKYKDKATQSITDALTGLFNRAYMNDYVKSQLPSLEGLPPAAPQRQMSVVIVDIDFFKKVNDVHGHQAGDHVIRTTAELIKKAFRKTDVPCRYGGEEFVTFLPGTDAPGAVVAADKLRQLVQSTRIEFEGKHIPVTISAGVAQLQVGGESGDQAIARADHALYFSKQSGRNRVSLHDGVKSVETGNAQPPLVAETPKAS